MRVKLKHIKWMACLRTELVATWNEGCVQLLERVDGFMARSADWMMIAGEDMRLTKDLDEPSFDDWLKSN
jgi:hypothetical protein